MQTQKIKERHWAETEFLNAIANMIAVEILATFKEDSHLELGS